MNAPCPNPNRCLFTGCGGDCEPPRQAAAAPDFGQNPSAFVLGQLAFPRPTEVPRKTRDAFAHRRLLVAALS